MAKKEERTLDLWPKNGHRWQERLTDEMREWFAWVVDVITEEEIMPSMTNVRASFVKEFGSDDLLPTDSTVKRHIKKLLKEKQS